MKSTAPRLIVRDEPHRFTWVDVVLMLAVLALLWSLMHFGRGMLVRFSPVNEAPLDLSVSSIPYYAGRTFGKHLVASWQLSNNHERRSL